MKAGGQKFSLPRDLILPKPCENSVLRTYGGGCGTTTGALLVITLQIEHEVRDFATWKEAFDSDPLGRSASGVRSFRISRPLDQEDYVMLEMDFDTQEAAVDFLARLQNDTWKTGVTAPTLVGEPSTRIVETVAIQSMVQT
jgi:hypothetical protein